MPILPSGCLVHLLESVGAEIIEVFRIRYFGLVFVSGRELSQFNANFQAGINTPKGPYP
jgi:hypothetical protein